MKAVAVVLAVLLAAAAALVLVVGAGDDAYRVRAIFDNAGFLIAGEDVKVAGVVVGAIEEVEVTPDFKAAVVLRIDDPGYRDFRADARCSVRPQSLIGERFVECEPTRARAAGAEAPGPLREIAEGEPGEGQKLLPVENTSKSVDLDLINNILREPQRARLSIILNELGVGLAGRGADLDAVIRRANPALRELDDVVRLLARQNDQLEQLAVDSDTIMAPLARERRRVSSAIENMSEVGAATAERRADLEANVARLPRFLRELRPTMTRLGALADEMSPVVSDLGEVAPDINRFLLELGPFSEAGIPALDSLGEAAQVGRPAVEASLPVVRDVGTLASASRPVGRRLAEVLASFEAGDGIASLMEYIFFQATAVNGFDAFGHYLRAGLIVNQCSTYAVEPTAGCSANFRRTAGAAGGTATTAAAAGQPRDPVLAWTARVLQGLDAGAPPQARRTAASAASAPRASAPAPAATPAPAPDVPLLDYLFGAEG